MALDLMKLLFMQQNQNGQQPNGLLTNTQQPQTGLLGGLFNDPTTRLLIGANIIGRGVKGQDPFSAATPSILETAKIKTALTPKIKTKAVFDSKTGKTVYRTEQQIAAANQIEPDRFRGEPKESIASKLETNLSSKYISAKPVVDFNKSTDSVKKLLVGLEKNDGVGDLASIFTFMKTLDPDSVVRESEFATAENSSGAFRKYWNIWNKLRRGDRLTETQREQFKEVGIDLYKSSVEGLDQFRGGFNLVSQNKGLNTDNIFIDVDFRPKKIKTPDGKEIQTPAGATLIDYRNGKYYWKIPGFEKPYETDGRGL